MPTPFFRRRSYLPLFVEQIVAIVAHLLYRVRSCGAEHLPAQGGAVIIANHLSYVDVVMLQLASPRRLRFIGFRDPRQNWFTEFLLRCSGAILISSRQPTDGMKQAIRCLRAGELVCVFPEGHISRTGQLMEIKRGFSVMARHANVPVIPAAIDGVWGSVFSFAGNKYLWKSPRLMPTPVFVAFGAPIPPQQATIAVARKAMLDQGAIAFDERPVLRRNLARECVQSLAKAPGHVLVIDRTAERRPLKAATILAVAAALARRFRKTIPEKRVGIVLPPGAGAFLANLGVICAGKVPVNLNFTLGSVSSATCIRMAEVKTVISAEAMRAKIPNFPWPERTLDITKEIAACGKKGILPWLVAAWVLPNQWVATLLGLPRVGDREEAGLLFTSGSAGEPKGVMLTHRNILANCSQIASLPILPAVCSIMGCLPLFHSFGFTVTLWFPMLRRCRVVTVPSPLDTRKIVDSIRDEAVTVLVGAPTFIRPILKKAQPSELKSLDIVVTGAEKLPDDLYRAFLETFHIEILQGYGLTETTPVTNVNQPDPPADPAANVAEPQQGKRTGSTGRLFPGMTARVVDPDTGRELAVTETGMVLFRGANVFSGYLNDEEKTRAAFRDGWFVTGDLGRFDEDGFLFIEGRLSRFSKIGGEMVPHVTIEQKIIDVFRLDQTERLKVAVTAVPDATKGEALVLLTTETIAGEELRARLLDAGLPNLWVPKIIQRIEAIPLLGSGKLDIKACRQFALQAVGA